MNFHVRRYNDMETVPSYSKQKDLIPVCRERGQVQTSTGAGALVSDSPQLRGSAAAAASDVPVTPLGVQGGAGDQTPQLGQNLPAASHRTWRCFPVVASAEDKALNQRCSSAFVRVVSLKLGCSWFMQRSVMALVGWLV